jgi:hypothetical protein
MYGTPKPTASLSSGLLARKGHARPAMRPQGFVQLNHAAPHEDLGWNDMGDETAPPVPVVAPAPVETIEPQPTPPVLQQRAALDEQFGEAAVAPEPAPAPVPAPRPVAKAATPGSISRAVKAAKTKAAFTLRLDNNRHLRLRLASAVHNRSAQHLVTEALDAFLDSLTEVDALARQLDARDRG